MNDIYFKCICGKSMAVDIRGIGLTINCVDCARDITVPDADIDFTCANCAGLHLAPAAIHGDQVICTICGHRIPVVNTHTEFINPALRQRYPGFQVRRAPSQLVNRNHTPITVRRLVPPALAISAILIIIAASRQQTTRQEDSVIPGNIHRQTTVIAPVAQSETEPPDHTDAEPLHIAHMPPKTFIVSEPATPDIIPADEIAVQYAVKPAKIKSTISHDETPEIASSTPPTAPESSSHAASNIHPAEHLALRCRQLNVQFRQNRFNKDNRELIDRIRELHQDFLVYTRNHAGSDIDAQYWGMSARRAVWMASTIGHETFETADQLFRESIKVIAAADSDNPELPRRIIFDLILAHLQEWRYRAPAELCARWLDKANAMAQAGSDPHMTVRRQLSAGSLEVSLIFTSSAPRTMPPEQFTAFRTNRESNIIAYLKDDSIPLQFRQNTLYLWAAALSGADEPAVAIRLIDDWRRQYDNQTTNPAIFSLRMFLAFHHEGSRRNARAMIDRVALMVKNGQIPKDNQHWQNMTEKYYAYLMIPEYEIKRHYRRGVREREKSLKEKT